MHGKPTEWLVGAATMGVLAAIFGLQLGYFTVIFFALLAAVCGYLYSTNASALQPVSASPVSARLAFSVSRLRGASTVATIGGVLMTFIALVWAAILVWGIVWGGHRGTAWLDAYLVGATIAELTSAAAVLLLVWWEYYHPQQHMFAGVLIIIFSFGVLSFPPGSLLIGPAIGTIGGALVIALRPPDSSS